jgi:large subunit ribosomal protein L15
MQLHELKPIHKRKRGKRIGRGGKRGTYCGRGVKGQKSRAGRKMVPSIRQLIKKYPKLRGYRFKPRRPKPETIDVDILEKNFEKGDLVSPKILLEKKLISRMKGKTPKVKILGRGKLNKNLTVENCQVSKSAKEKIEKVKGVIKL